MPRPEQLSIISPPRISRVEVTDTYERDVSEDAASVPTSRSSTAIASSAREAGTRRSGDRLPEPPMGARGFTPHRRPCGLCARARWTVHLSGTADPAFYAKQVIASLLKYGSHRLPPFFGGLTAYDGEANVAFDCPDIRAGSSTEVSRRATFLPAFGESVFRNDLCNADVDLGRFAHP